MMPDYGRHRQRAEDSEVRQERSWWAWTLGGAMAIVFFAVTAVASVVVVDQDTRFRGQTLNETMSIVAPSTPTPTQRPTPTRISAATAAPRGVVGRRIDRRAVLEDTTYVRDYRRAFGAIARGHTDAGLATDGAEICADVLQRTTKSHLAVGLWEDERHDGTPPSLATVYRIIALALMDICPKRRAAWDRLRQ
jgi:hypothetical protein